MKLYEIDENPERDLEYAFAKSWDLGAKYKLGRIKKKDLFSPEYFTSLEKMSKNTPSGTNQEKTTDQKKIFKEIFRHIEKLFDHPLPIEIIKLRFGVDGSDTKTWEETYNILKDKYPHLKGPSSIRKIEKYAFERIRANIPNFPHLKDLMYDDTQNILNGIDYCVNCGQLTFEDNVDENLKKWFKEKWVRFGPDGKIRGDCARGSSSEGKPKCLPQSKAHALGKKGRAKAASRKRRQDPNKNRKGPAKNVKTK
jgi:hypothetical protein